MVGKCLHRKGRGIDICGLHRGMMLVEHAIKVLDRVFERNIGRIDKMHFGFMAEKTTTDAIY